MFDGDEMNIHVAQSIQARNELKRIANVSLQIIGAKDSNPIIGCVQDALSGAYLLTQPDVRVKGCDVANFLCNTSSDTKFEIDMEKIYTGHEIFSYIIPKGINTIQFKNDKKTFEIVDGQLTVGKLDKSTLSKVKNSIIHFIWDKYGPNKTRRFIDDSQRLVLSFLAHRGFTIGFGDILSTDKVNDLVKQMANNKINEYNVLLTQYENDIDQLDPAIVENILRSDLNAFSVDIGNTVSKTLDNKNNLFVMIDSKSKGSIMNVQHMMCCVGQKTVEGTRIKKKVENRSLPIFHRDDDTPEARGFIKSSFVQGVNTFEYFYDAMAGREGLIDTAIKSVTWETPIVIIENNQPKYIQIGKWIDNLLDNNKDKVQHFIEREMELLDTKNIYIPTTDYKGNVSWGEVSAITRHDPGLQLYEIKTRGGRIVTVTESKSLLIWNNETLEFKEVLTPEIKMGDFVPVTAELSKPPIIKEYIELSDYLSKKEYIYGSDYHKAVNQMVTVMKDRNKIPSGWWNECNGKEFTLPYSKKSSLQRCLIRSNQENIIRNCVYPYSAKRSKTTISDKFNMNYDNGIFIGLFLSEGSISGESIRITNNNENIKLFVKNWFDNQSIEWNEEIKINKIGGLSTSIRGNSAILTRFLTKLVGKGAENKYVPNEAFIAPETFIIGLLNGYFSGDGCITKNSIDASSASKRLIEGILMLCSRLGIYGKMYTSQLKQNNLQTKNIKPSYRLRISAQWAKIFSDKITLLEDVKNKKMKDKKWINSHLKFKTLNNVVLDEIIEINLVDVKNHPKVYDLTIPTTFNFGLANGLQVRDTAKTGYIQRQLIKGLEDLSIKYDMTNRNSKNVIIQYVYGENGIEQSKQTMLPIDMLSMNNTKIDEVFGFTTEEIKKLESKLKLDNISKLNKKYIEKIILFRNNLRNIQQVAHNNYKVLEEKYFLPVNLLRIIQDYSNKKEHLELTPQYILDSIEDLLISEETRLLPALKKTDKYLLNDDRSLKYLLEIAIHNYLCPKKCIFNYGLTKSQFDNIIKDIKLNFVKALVEPGEMVGIIAAQSIGEPASQMSTLQYHQLKVIIKNKKNNVLKIYSGEIGKLINKIIKKNPELTYGTGHENSLETDLDTLNKEYYIIGVDNQEKTHWNKISHVSRHPVNGQIAKVKTRSGRIIETTLSHSHLIRRNQTVEPILGSELKVGMRIPVAKHINNTFIQDNIEIDNNTYKLDYLFGWFIGAYLAEGCMNGNIIKITNISKHFIDNTTKFAKLFNKEVTIRNYQGGFGPGVDTTFKYKELKTFIVKTCNTGSFNKKVPDFAFLAPNEFKAGLIQAYFDGDGEFICKTNNSSYNLSKTNYSGNFNNHGNRNNIRACSRSEQLIKDIALLLNYFDIFAHLRCDFVKGSKMYELDISSKYGPLYKQHIGTMLYEDKLNDIINYTSRNDIHNVQDEIDKINGLGEIIAKCGKELKLPGQSRNYGRWLKKESIGRRTLQKYIEIFEAHENSNLIQPELNILKQAANSNVIWDEIKEIEIYTPDQSIYVYDFTVPGNQTFMIDNGIIIHNTLNTKHSAGSASKSTGGVPRIEELLHYSKDIKTPQMKVYFNDDIAGNKNKVNKIASYLKFLTIRELIDSAQIYFDSGTNDELSTKLKNDNVQNPFFINNQKADLSTLQLVFRIKLNMEKLHDKETTLLDIKTKFISYWQKNFSNLKNLKKNEKEIFTKITRCCILSNNDKNDQIIHIRFSMSLFNYIMLTDFLKIILDQIILKGINNINGVNMEASKRLITDNITGDYKLHDEFVVYTEGINLEKLKYIKGINLSRTACNDIETMYRLYGIEAARQTLLNEFMTTFGSDTINHNHMSVLIDMMTHTGNITSIDRHGLGKLDSDVFTRASFEKTMDHFINAAIFNEKDTTNSVSSRILLGKVIPGGTGSFELLLDSEKIENSEYTKDETGGRPTFNMLEEDPLFKDIIKYGFTKNDIFIPVN
jgi:DNA-directed RNA polymerase beta' subunit